MLQFIVEVFVLLHGMVHLLYFGQSRRLFELKPGIVWPDGSWEFSKLLGAESTRILASICCVVAAITFIAGGLGLFIGQGWSRPVIIAAAVLSAVSFILF